jgi:4a-hydroxytetrahydrobiopterin dehydratase
VNRGEITAAVQGHGWRFLLGTIRTRVPVASLADATQVATRAASVAGAGDGLWVDLRPDAVLFSLRSVEHGWVTSREIDLARAITEELDHATQPGPLQVIEIAIDAVSIPTVRPFWKAILDYADDGDALVDPAGQGPAVWFQQMDAPRPQRNRIHLDICVTHDEAQRRLASALAAGGTLLSAAHAPSFWVLSDAEGNEACVTTWQGRD